MTLSDARLSAAARSIKGETIAVVKAVPGEVYKGYYPESYTPAIPEEQIDSLWRYGVRALSHLDASAAPLPSRARRA